MRNVHLYRRQQDPNTVPRGGTRRPGGRTGRTDELWDHRLVTRLGDACRTTADAADAVRARKRARVAEGPGG